MTPEEIEEAKAARRMQAILLGQDPRRIALCRAPNTAVGFLRYSIDRIEQAARMLMELEFLETFSLDKPAFLPDDDWRKHVAEKCVEGIKKYDDHYGNCGRFNYNGKPNEHWQGQLDALEKLRGC